MRSKHNGHGLTGVVTFAALATISGTAAGQTYQKQQTAPATQGAQPAAKVDKETVEAFAIALNAVQEIRSEYSEKIMQAREPAFARELQQESQAEMLEAVEEAGLSVDKYNALATQMQANPEFRERVERALGKQ
jgi:ribosome-binding protein aMBF1 (putative translation factor)